MDQEELILEAFTIYSKYFWGEHHFSPITVWGFQEIVPDNEKQYYIDRARISIRMKKINQIKQKYENR